MPTEHQLSPRSKFLIRYWPPHIRGRLPEDMKKVWDELVSFADMPPLHMGIEHCIPIFNEAVVAAGYDTRTIDPKTNTTALRYAESLKMTIPESWLQTLRPVD